MPTRNVVLTEHQASLVDRLVASGHYQNASEVLRDGLRLIERRDAEESAKLEALREAARIGVEDIAAGRFCEFSDARSLQHHLAALADESSGAQSPHVPRKAVAASRRRRA